MRFPIRRTERTCLLAPRIGGSNDLTRNALAIAGVLERLAYDAAAQMLDVDLRRPAARARAGDYQMS